jgi:hypothetical protein
MGNQYSVSLRETTYIGGTSFINQDRVYADTIVEALKAIQKKSQTLANRWSSPFAKAFYGDKRGYETQFDYTGRPGYLKMDQHNPAVLTFRGYWGDKAQSDNHVAPSINVELCFQGPIGHGITDVDVYHLLTYFYVNHFNVYYDRLPSQRQFYRERIENVRKKNNAEGLQFPPSFIVPASKEVA